MPQYQSTVVKLLVMMFAAYDLSDRLLTRTRSQHIIVGSTLVACLPSVIICGKLCETAKDLPSVHCRCRSLNRIPEVVMLGTLLCMSAGTLV